MSDLRYHIEDNVGVFKQLFWECLQSFNKNPVQEAQTTIYCAVAEESEVKTGLYYSN